MTMANRTMTTAQMDWSVKKGFAWPDPANDHEDCHCLREIFWTSAGGWMWNVDLQAFELVI
jgi:hypothetical protein